MKLTIDFESRSELSLLDCGVWPYSVHPTTDIYCMAYKIDGYEPMIWINEMYSEGVTLPQQTDFPNDLFNKAEEIEAHNSEFERVMYGAFRERYGWAKVPFGKWHCSAAEASSLALPRKLEKACLALDLDVKKDMDGRKIMLKYCKPRRVTKKNPKKWNDDPAELKKMYEYCLQDVEAEYALSQALKRIKG